MNDPAIQKDEGADRPGHRAAGVGDAVSIRKKSTDAKGNEEADRRRSVAKRSLLERKGQSTPKKLKWLPRKNPSQIIKEALVSLHRFIGVLTRSIPAKSLHD